MAYNQYFEVIFQKEIAAARPTARPAQRAVSSSRNGTRVYHTYETPIADPSLPLHTFALRLLENALWTLEKNPIMRVKPARFSYLYGVSYAIWMYSGKSSVGRALEAKLLTIANLDYRESTREIRDFVEVLATWSN